MVEDQASILDGPLTLLVFVHTIAIPPYSPLVIAMTNNFADASGLP